MSQYHMLCTLYEEYLCINELLMDPKDLTDVSEAWTIRGISFPLCRNRNQNCYSISIIFDRVNNNK